MCYCTPNRVRLASLAVTPLSLHLLGDALISIHTSFSEPLMGTLEGRRYVDTNYRAKMSYFVQKKPMRALMWLLRLDFTQWICRLINRAWKSQMSCNILDMSRIRADFVVKCCHFLPVNSSILIQANTSVN